MKLLLIVFSSLLLNATLFAQNVQQVDSIKLTINTFFEGMHKKDTTLIRSTLTSSITMHTIQKLKNGDNKIIVEPIENFFTQIINLPASIKKIEEKITFENILIDDAMAMAWTPFQLYFNDVFYSCGVNHFQLVKINGSWKINFIIDTRRKNCE